MDKQKWHTRQENLKPNDIVYFKLTESKMSAKWLIGKVEEVKIGRDGCVRDATVAYKDTTSDNSEDWIHRTVDRPVRNLVKLFHLDDTCLMDDINSVHKLAKEILNKEKISYDEPVSLDHNQTKVKVTSDNENCINTKDDDDIDAQQKENYLENLIPNKARKSRKKRKTELENLEIQMKGWNSIKSSPQAQIRCPFTNTPDEQDPVPKRNTHYLALAMEKEAGNTEEMCGEGEGETETEFGMIDLNNCDCKEESLDNDPVYLI